VGKQDPGVGSAAEIVQEGGAIGWKGVTPSKWGNLDVVEVWKSTHHIRRIKAKPAELLLKLNIGVLTQTWALRDPTVLEMKKFWMGLGYMTLLKCGKRSLHWSQNSILLLGLCGK
jgi:hypothetical protein